MESIKPDRHCLTPNPRSRAVLIRHVRTLTSALFVLAMIFAPASAWGVMVPNGPHTFDGTLPVNAFLSYNGTSFVTPAVAPKGTMGISIDSGALHQDYLLTNFHIDSGFTVTSAFVYDPDQSQSISNGDAIFVSTGPGSFDFTDGLGIILTGSFTSATFTSSVGSTAGALNASNINGLVLTPGPGFAFDNSHVSAILASPTGFSLSLTSIPGGVTATQTGPEVGFFIPASLNAFGFSSGSAGVSGVMVVVPEPSAILLAGFGGMILLGAGWQGRRKCVPAA